ncbi:hypothetical protein [Catalinimonas niigatensis]|uniref:hypothetical protein n=1 Tax=Catalinimonas niigatensis TaxID=1397264 RepID=UPI002665B9F2|nr:hypothetical protein [Catalinimonas niigatensis]WPP51924.1 hypothetical protein PZB72_05930 [Catalinimonas niigatensis]
MSYLSEYIIPATLGKTFLLGTDYSRDYQKVLKILGKIKGISRVDLNDEVFPREITIYTECPVAVKEVQQSVKAFGFHAIPKSFLLSFF